LLEFKRKPIEGVFPLMPLCLKDNQEIDYYSIDLLPKNQPNFNVRMKYIKGG